MFLLNYDLNKLKRMLKYMGLSLRTKEINKLET